MTERRKHTRLPIALKVEMKLQNGDHCLGNTINVSFGGILADFPDFPPVTLGDSCQVSILLSEEGPERMAIELECQVMRQDEGKLGFQFMKFTTMDLESFIHFKNLMLLNSPDPEAILQELELNPGIILTGS